MQYLNWILEKVYSSKNWRKYQKNKREEKMIKKRITIITIICIGLLFCTKVEASTKRERNRKLSKQLSTIFKRNTEKKTKLEIHSIIYKLRLE